MRALRGIPSLLLVAGVVAVLLRLAHVGLPLLQPGVLPGPFGLADPAAAEDVVGFVPLVPVVHPESLGADPVEVSARRRPVREVEIRWRGERRLRLVERRAADRTLTTEPGETVTLVRGIPVRRGAFGYRVVGEVGGLWVELDTDLEPREAVRVFSSLAPVR